MWPAAAGCWLGGRSQLLCPLKWEAWGFPLWEADAAARTSGLQEEHAAGGSRAPQPGCWPREPAPEHVRPVAGGDGDMDWVRASLTAIPFHLPRTRASGAHPRFRLIGLSLRDTLGTAARAMDFAHRCGGHERPVAFPSVPCNGTWAVLGKGKFKGSCHPPMDTGGGHPGEGPAVALPHLPGAAIWWDTDPAGTRNN